ncbi:MAG TPA: hypothetical protein VJA26_07835 [Gammaproteobacteria bacterium]|nr:hypothetical protein [Gammaproteobacteria bacterium]
MSALAAILELTDLVQAAINDGDWQRAHVLENERRGRLEELVAAQAQAQGDGHDALRATLTGLQQRSQQMIGEVHHHRRRILREASMLKAGHEAAGAYGDTRTEP